MTDKEVMDPDNWLDCGLTDHLEDAEKFPEWEDVAIEGARILGAEPGSAAASAIFSIAAAAARLGRRGE